jgi:hypothetical protein
MPSTTQQTAVGVEEIQRYVADWYVALDRHVPFEKVTEYLAGDEIRFVFPETTVTDLKGLSGWYDTVTGRFFDEAHRVEVADVEIDGDNARVHVVVNWQTSVWNPPQPDSQRLEFEADQSWELDLSTGRPLLKTYVVNSFVPLGDTPELF